MVRQFIFCEKFCQILNDVSVCVEEWFVPRNLVFRRDNLVICSANFIENNPSKSILKCIFKFVDLRMNLLYFCVRYWYRC